MLLINVAVTLVAGLMLFEPFARAPVSRFTTSRMRRNLANRSFFQAGAAFFTALLIATNPPTQQISPLIVLAVAVLFVLAGIYWVVRGKRLRRQPRVFGHTY
jgi:Flp pilus assembly protein TadB